MIAALKFDAGPIMTSQLETLAWSAARFPRRGRLSIYSAWDGIALADFAARTKIPLVPLYNKRFQRCIETIRAHDGPKAFLMRALITVAGYHLHMARLYIDLKYHPTDEEIIAACDMLDKAQTEQKRRASALRASATSD